MLQFLFQRFIAPTPKYFLWASHFFLGLAANCAAAIMFWNTLNLGELPPFMQKTFHTIGIIATVSFIVTRMQVKESDPAAIREQEKKDQENK